MRSRSLAPDHEAAVARRLELLSSELAGVRGDPPAATRIRVLPDLDPEPDDDPPPLPPVARRPGRHASRRALGQPTGWPGAVPEPLRGRVALGPGQLAVVAVLAAVGLVVTCWFLLRSGGHEVAVPLAVETSTGALAHPAGAGRATGATSAPGTKVVVDVAGRVRHPGIAVLRSGARVVDAIRAAGGARRGADTGSLNLAQVLTDGEQIVVGGPAPPTGVAAAATGAPPAAGLVHLNTADETTLESLPEVGPVTAQAIIAWRTEHGGFSAVSQLLDVDGIGDATLAQITPFVTL